jgi:signal transduction histidine kinase
LSRIAYQYFQLSDIDSFKIINREAYKLALTLKDTFTLADFHWNNANFYKRNEVYDSAYYNYNKAYGYFESIDKQYYAAKMLYGMALIKGHYRDYYGSEILIIKAISKYEFLKKNKSLYASYNHLALLQSDIKEYDKALYYHKKSLSYIDKPKNKKDFYQPNLNNIGLVYLNKGNYLKALDYFNEILDNDSIKITDIEQYARVIDNRAYCKLLNNDTTNLKQDLYKSLRIRDSLDNKGGIVISKIHLAEYYRSSQDSIKAIKYAKEANVLAKNIRNNRDYLASLRLLSKLDKKKSEDYLEKYITFSDSLQNYERKIHDKFTRIAYETDEYIEENKYLSQQKLQLFIIGLIILIIVSLIYIIQIQKTRNEKLLIEAEHQKTNEQVYILTIKQQALLEDEREKERNRISEELHDGILGKLFGIRINLGFLNLNGNDDTLKQHESYLKELQGIEKEIREVSHKLNSNVSSSEINFITLLDQLLKIKNNIGNFTSRLDSSKDIIWEEISDNIKANLYRIIQEALQNIVKYANAKNVVIDLSVKEEDLIVSINDDGIGFNIKKTKKGIGIKNIKSRIQKLNGVLGIKSEIGIGTTIHFTIPIH